MTKVCAGDNFTLKIKKGDREYQTITGVRMLEFDISGDYVDVSNINSEGWKELLPEKRSKQVSFTIKGVVLKETSDGVFDIITSEDKIDLEITSETGHRITGDFVCKSYKRGAYFDKEEYFVLSFVSSGKVSFNKIEVS